ncbi:DUF3243 domain-containing protein [Metabacillus bambusae]|uniref:DUF3243 domain-containing protein n=1 Tax=Metabacillus bambusae TaxID=2795218 RepID=A0ABS3N3D2_9BACI|nr:DUF3243 domain-containing protein [Metabacillus bambusae]MBO1512591.1 DUF3243 domain-containing protein [Metabacillus bambusae]
MDHQNEVEHSAHINKVERAVNGIGQEKKQEILANFESFKEFLGKKVAMGKKMGLTEEQLALATQKVADFLAEHEYPRNREEKLLQELWRAGSDDERHMLSHMLIKLVRY